MSTLIRTSVGQPLLRPLQLGDLQLPNRTVMAPATRARAAGDGLVPTDLHAAYYGQRAGAGLIVTEGTWVGERAVGFVHVPGVWSEEQVGGWRRVTDVVHCLGGRIVLQLWHTGAVSHPDHLGGERPLGPSAVDPRETSFTADGRRPTVTPRAMTRAEIEETVAEYGTASANARRAGFDGVEIHAVGPYLIPQFLNPRLNLRTDAYGGTPARRRRLLMEIVGAAAAPWPGRRVGVRLSPYWTSACFAPDARTLAEFDELVDVLNGCPLSYLHLRGRDPSPSDDGPDFAALDRYRRLFHGPLIANNGFDRASANALIEAGTADAVSFATHFIANPDLVSRFALGQELTAGDPATYYSGGAEGYVDYPVCAHWSR